MDATLDDVGKVFRPKDGALWTLYEPQLVTDLKHIALLALEKQQENHDFRTWAITDLQMDDAAFDLIVQEIVTDVTERVDCTQCGNCCKHFHIGVDDDDIVRLATSQKISFTAFERSRVMKSEDGDKCLMQSPCEFLDGTVCTVYEYRPTTCRDFPYLHLPKFRDYMDTAVDNTKICPIAYNTLEVLKWRMGLGSKKK